MTARRAGLAGMFAVALAACTLGAPKSQTTLETVNPRWAQSFAALRLSLPVKPGDDRTPFYKHKPDDGPTFYYALRVSDRSAIAPLLQGDTLPAGTRFRVIGWDTRPDSEKGLHLKLHFIDADATAEFRFIKQWSFSSNAFPLDRLDQVERYLRVALLDLSAANEQVGDVPLGVDTTQDASVSHTGSPVVGIRGIAVSPLLVRPGEAVELTANYALNGAGQGGPVPVMERWEILAGGVVRLTLDENFERSATEITSTTSFEVPPGAPPGLYEARCEIRVGNRRESRSALFEIRP